MSRRRKSLTRKRLQSGQHGPKLWPDVREHLSGIVENSSDAIYSRTPEGIITTWNAAAERIFGYTSVEIIGRTGTLLLPPGRKDESRRLMAKIRRGQIVQHFETERINKDGQIIHVSLTLSPIRDAAGRLIGFSTIARDISENRQVRQALQRRESELDDLFEEAPVGLLLVSPGGEVLRANQAFLNMLELRPEQLTGQPLDAFHPHGGLLDDCLIRLAGRETITNLPTEFRTARGETRFVLVDANGLWEQGQLVHSRWFVRDISRRRQLQRELLETGDRERRGFAQELHDGLGQQLGGIAYLANVLRERLAERNAPEAGEAFRIFELVRKAVEQTRRLARGLSPLRPEPEGLMDALRDLSTQTTDLFRVQCRLRCPKPVLLSDAVVASHLYRIAQEAVNNAVKHGKPRSISISLRNTRNRLTLTVDNDGKSIGPLSPKRDGLGLRIMQYRASLIRGVLTVEPRPTSGTTVACEVALPSPDSAASGRSSRSR